MDPEKLAHCSIIGFIWRKRGDCHGNNARRTVAHKFIAARATEIGFLNDDDLYIEPVSAEVLLVKSTHQLSVWGERAKWLSSLRGEDCRTTGRQNLNQS